MSQKPRITTHSSEQTEALASQIGTALKGGEVIELISDVGGGKTTFVRGLVRGAGSTDAVASPTFTISKVYNSKDITIAHFDFYRLDEPGLMRHELAEHLHDPMTVTIVEWPDNVEDVLPKSRLQIHITTDGKNLRTFEFDLPEAYSYLENAVST